MRSHPSARNRRPSGTPEGDAGAGEESADVSRSAQCPRSDRRTVASAGRATLAITAWLSRAAIGHAVLMTVSPVVVQSAVVAAEIGAAVALTAAFRRIAEVVAPPPTRRASSPSPA